MSFCSVIQVNVHSMKSLFLWHTGWTNSYQATRDIAHENRRKVSKFPLSDRGKFCFTLEHLEDFNITSQWEDWPLARPGARWVDPVPPDHRYQETRPGQHVMKGVDVHKPNMQTQMHVLPETSNLRANNLKSLYWKMTSAAQNRGLLHWKWHLRFYKIM